MSDDWRKKLKEMGKQLKSSCKEKPAKVRKSKSNNPKDSNQEGKDESIEEKTPNLGYKFQTQDYYMRGTEVKKDVETIINFQMKPDINEMVRKRQEELSSLVMNDEVISNTCSFQAEVNYPGLIVGMSNPVMCSLKRDMRQGKEDQNDAFKTGFSFDYTTGLPYIAGSSIKGMLKAFITKYQKDVMAWLCNNIDISKTKEISLNNLIDQLFGDDNTAEMVKYCDEKHSTVLERDVFLDAMIVSGDEKGNILKSDYITPHPSMFKNPKPIHILALKPGVKLEFCFLLRPGNIAEISKEKRFELYKNLILELGIGAKTNTGYGNLTESMRK